MKSIRFPMFFLILVATVMLAGCAQDIQNMDFRYVDVYINEECIPSTLAKGGVAQCCAPVACCHPRELVAADSVPVHTGRQPGDLANHQVEFKRIERARRGRCSEARRVSHALGRP